MFSLSLVGLLAKVFVWGMISPRYRCEIIVYDIKSVQNICSPATVVESYLAIATRFHSPGTLLKSYPTPLIEILDKAGYIEITILESYLSTPLNSSLTIPITVLLILLVGLVNNGEDSSLDQKTFDEFSTNPADEATENERDLPDLVEEGSADNDREEEESTETIEEQEYDSAYGYTRQSQTEAGEEDDSNSIRTQKKNSTQAAADEDLAIAKFFVDKNESGFSFERGGFNELSEQLEKDPKPVALDRIDRLGRDTLETIYVAAFLHYKYEIPIITHKFGKYELDKSSDQVQLVVKAIVAGESVKDRIRAAWDAIYDLFEEDKKWYAWFKKLPVGYEIPEDETWPEPHPDGEAVVTAIRQDFCDTKSYQETIRLLKKASRNQTLENQKSSFALPSLSPDAINAVFDASDYEIDNFKSGQLRRMLTNPVYRGKVVYPQSADEEDQHVMEDDNLAMGDERLYNDALEVVDEIRQKRTPDASDSVDVEGLSEMGILLQATDVIDNFGPICPDCGRGMVKNGRDVLKDGKEAHYWICPKYNEDDEDPDRQRKVPTEKEWKSLKKHIDEEYPDSDVVLLEICRYK